MPSRKILKSQRASFSRRITEGSTYAKAYSDTAFMARRELRPVRLQLELLKPDIILREHGIKSTVVVFGSARIKSPETARAELSQCRRRLKTHPKSRIWKRKFKEAQHHMDLSRYYDEARRFSRLISLAQKRDRNLEFVVVTGGGPGIMEASNRGAFEVRTKSIGLNITLPHEQAPNPYITPDLAFQFHYFSIRKMHFMMRAKAMAAFPGGFGTFDELFEALTLVQTGKKSSMPVVLFGREFWRRAVDFEFLADQGMIAHKDLKLFKIVETAEEGWDHIRRHWRKNGASAPAD